MLTFSSSDKCAETRRKINRYSLYVQQCTFAKLEEYAVHFT